MKNQDFSKIDRKLSKQARRIINRSIPLKIRKLHEQLLLLTGDTAKKLAATRERIRRQCTHGLLIEIPRRRIYVTAGLAENTRVIPPTRICLACGDHENATQTRRGGKLRAVFAKLTAKPIIVRGDFYSVTTGMLNGDRPIQTYVMASLASSYPEGDRWMRKIMHPSIYQ